MNGPKLPWFITDPDPSYYLSDQWLAIDLETTNKNKGDAGEKSNRLIYGYWYSPILGSGEVYSEQELKYIIELAVERGLFILAHGGKFELKWFKRSGVKIEHILLYDTLLGDYVRAGNRRFNLDLDSTTRRYGGKGKAGYVSRCIHSGICPSELPSVLLKAYCKQDVQQTIHVFLEQRKYLNENGLLAPLYIRCLTTPVLADIELNGIHLDKDTVYAIRDEAVNRYECVTTALSAITGGINMASPQQVAAFVYGELGFEELQDRKGKYLRNAPCKAFPEGTPKTDENTIELLKARTPEQKEFIELKKEESKLRKKISSYINRFVEAVDNNEGMIHGKLNQSIAQTHRLTSNDPNLQNVDRKLKKCITPRYKDWKIRGADYKTLEMTAAGQLANDTQCLEDILTGHDFHSYTASIVFDREWVLAGGSRDSDDGDELRTESKPHTFKPLYGGTSGTKKEQAYYSAFRLRYPDIDRMQNGWIKEVLDTKQLRTVTGLIFYWPDTAYTRSGYIQNTSSISNYPIQMFATADLSPTGVCILWHKMKALELKSFIINEVHDSVLAEQHPEEGVILRNLIDESLSKDVIEFFDKLIGFKLTFPFVAEQHEGDTW